MTSSEAWYLAYSQPNSETKACGYLKNSGYETYCPLVRERRSHAGKIDWVLRPFLPRYVFVLVKPEQSVSPVRSIPGISNLVRCGIQAATVPLQFITAIREREHNGVIQLPKKVEHQSRYRKGEELRLIDGQFVGWNAIFLYQKGEDRAMVLLSMLGKAEVRLRDVCLAAEWDRDSRAKFAPLVR